MSKPVIWFRSFNAFLGQTVSVWSVGFLIAPWILSIIIAGFFASPIVVPLAVVCAIVGAVALVWGGFIGYWRYLHLTKEADKFLNRYDLKIEESLPPKLDIPLNTIILIKNDKQTVAYFKRCIAGEDVVISVDITLTPEEEKIISPPQIEMRNVIAEEDVIDSSTENVGKKPAKEKTQTQTPRDPAINDIIQRVLSARGSIFNRPSILNQANELTQEQENIRTWERINAFLSDAPTAFIFSSIIIFLISHVFFGALIPSALLIAVVVSIAYGIFSAFIKDAQVDSKLQTMKGFKEEYEAIKAKSDAFMIEANAYLDRANLLIEKATERNQRELVLGVIKTREEVQNQMAELVPLQAKLPQISNDAHFEFTDKEWFRIIYAFVYGGIVGGSFLYIALPLFISALGLAPLSFPVLLTIVMCVAFAYGAYHAYHKVTVIRQEKWAAMDDEDIKKISESFEKIDQKMLLEESVRKIAEIEREFKDIEENVNLQLQDEPVSLIQQVDDAVQKKIEEIKEGTQSVVEQVAEQYHELGEGIVDKVNEYYLGIFTLNAELETIELKNFTDDTCETDSLSPLNSQ